MEYYAVKLAVIAVSGTTTGPIRIEAYDLIGIMVPTLDSTTFKCQVSDDDVTYYDLYDSTGTQALSWQTNTGNRAFGSDDLKAISGYTYARFVCGSAQNSGSRTITLRFKKQ